jgi:site-specific DNA-cytosine methylase
MKKNSPIPDHSPSIQDILIPISETPSWIVNPHEKGPYNTYLRRLKEYGHQRQSFVIDSDAKNSRTLLAGSVVWINDKRIGQVRKITPVELERLQTFPDHWTQGLPYTSRSKYLGNAVTCEVISYIMKHLMDQEKISNI